MENKEYTDYLRIVKAGSIYDWVDEENKDTNAPTVGYLDKRGIEEMEQQDLRHHPVLFKQFIERELRHMEYEVSRGKHYGYMLKKDLYELNWDYSMIIQSDPLRAEWYHSLEELKGRYMWLRERAYFVMVRDVNGNLVKDAYNRIEAL